MASAAKRTTGRRLAVPSPEEIRELRRSRDKSPQEIAEVVGVGWRTWYAWEAGTRKPSESAIILIRQMQNGER